MDYKIYDHLKYSICAPYPDKKEIKFLKAQMKTYKNEKTKKTLVAVYVFNKSFTHLLINLNRETVCFPHIYGFGGKWGVPKGKKEIYDKHDVDTAIRELYEETGYKIIVDDLYNCPIRLRNTTTYTVFMDDTCMNQLSTDFIEYEKEIQSVAWIPIDFIGTILPKDNCNSTLIPIIKKNMINTIKNIIPSISNTSSIKRE